MPRIVARLLLSMLVVPLGAVLFALTSMAIELAAWWSAPWALVICGVITWIGVAAYWLLLWRSSVRWNARRIDRTLGWAIVLAIAGSLLGYAVAMMSSREIGALLGTGVAVFGWLGMTAAIWQETEAERTTATKARPVVCPTCGYSLAGLRQTMCPECGASPTLEALIDGQPGNQGR